MKWLDAVHSSAVPRAIPPTPDDTLRYSLAGSDDNGDYCKEYTMLVLLHATDALLVKVAQQTGPVCATALCAVASVTSFWVRKAAI